MAGHWIAIGHEGFRGYLTRPSAEHSPGLLLLDPQPNREAMEAVADQLAEEGYLVLAPDLFWRIPLGEAQRHGSEARSLQNIAIALACLRTRCECSDKVGVLGFGLGGRLAYLAAARTDLDACVCYSPPGLETLLAERTAIGCPVLLHYAEVDALIAPAERSAVMRALSDRPEARVFVYPGVGHSFHAEDSAAFDKAAALMAYSRSIALLRQAIGPSYDLSALWEEHTFQEFGARDAAATMQSMVAQPYVNHIPTMTGGVGYDDLLRFYRHHFIPRTPSDTKLVPISRTIGADRLVDEMLFCFTHDIEIDWMLPGVPPTGRYVEIPLVAIVRFRGDKLYNEHIYWDQASVLVQIGLLDPAGLPVAGVETARKLLDEALPSNTLMRRWGESAGGG
jgi:carboxymethylenebutenolidase